MAGSKQRRNIGTGTHEQNVCSKSAFTDESCKLRVQGAFSGKDQPEIWKLTVGDFESVNRQARSLPGNERSNLADVHRALGKRQVERVLCPSVELDEVDRLVDASRKGAPLNSILVELRPPLR